LATDFVSCFKQVCHEVNDAHGEGKSVLDRLKVSPNVEFPDDLVSFELIGGSASAIFFWFNEQWLAEGEGEGTDG
jgi:hypothetical protein